MADHGDHDAYIEDYFFATVVSAYRLTPATIRVVLRVAGHERYVPSGHPDEWVRLAFPPAPGEAVTLPEYREGRWGRFDGSKPCPSRPYTVRRWNGATGEMMVDMVVHEGGVAASWAIGAKAGDIIGICNPEGRFWLPKGSRWLLMLVDITGLPAAARILEELPQGFRALVHVEVPSQQDIQLLASGADASVIWHVSHGPRPGRSSTTELPRIAAAIDALPEGPGYVCIAGEAKAASAARRHFRDTLGQPRTHIDAVGYWIEGQART
ncbi:siderophore-interacting protein [Fulvimarina endophytica]|uniref:Siderophore-interacting protein n=1 Tax=Fulvimarina endophytica TaxID=2293836 RepID=A0A371X9U2_9HYPH|nr:siderophore-interacting protein [Fulvimarina endophytica]